MEGVVEAGGKWLTPDSPTNQFIQRCFALGEMRGVIAVFEQPASFFCFLFFTKGVLCAG